MRSFIAVPFPDNLKDGLIGIQEEISSLGDIRNVEREKMHLTLKFLGEINEKQVDDIKEALQSISYPPFNLSIRGLGIFPNRNYVRVLWAGIDSGSKEIMNLQSIIEEKTHRLGFPKENGYIPHLTIARIRYLRQKEEFLKILDKYSGKEFGGCKVESLELMQSILSRTGPRYNRISGIYLK